MKEEMANGRGKTDSGGKRKKKDCVREKKTRGEKEVAMGVLGRQEPFKL